MPIYEFKCTQCGKHTERYFSEIKSRVNECEECGGLLALQIGVSRLKFTGEGFYVNDYKTTKVPDVCPD